jgi:hypothetical protein
MENTEFTEEQKLEILMLVPNFRNQLLGVQYLVNRFNLQDDKYLLPVYKEIANNIQTPGQEWSERFNNNN